MFETESEKRCCRKVLNEKYCVFRALKHVNIPEDLQNTSINLKKSIIWAP